MHATLACSQVTITMEEYLVQVWSEQHKGTPVPSGDDAIALLRLSLQAQTPDKQASLLTAWDELPASDRAILADEMARTGIAGQSFSRGPADLPRPGSGSFNHHRSGPVLGPALLVYYSPAFLRNMAPLHTYAALKMLAEVYHRARELWPLRPTVGNAHSVTVRIDQLKELKLAQVGSRDACMHRSAQGAQARAGEVT